MKSKEFSIDGQLNVSVTKRKSSRNIRISLGSDGQVRVSIPYYLPYSAAIAFVKTKKEWIEKHRPAVKVYTPGMQLGKNHHLQFIPSPNITKIQSRISGIEARVSYPAGISQNSEEVQKAAKELALKAYRSQAKALLPIRTQELAKRYGFNYGKLCFRNLKSRWGSCDHQGNITLNVKLMELPWDLVDYVILHELNHTKHLNHSPAFWDNLVSILPEAKNKRKELKKYRTYM